MPGKVATLTISWLSYTMCSYTSSLIIKTSCSQQRLQITEISSAEKTFPSGLWIVENDGLGFGCEDII